VATFPENLQKTVKLQYMKDKSHNAVCIQFSGGSDSSLTAYMAASEFDSVHLLTFRHFGHVNIENSRRSFAVLDKRFPNKFKHQIIDISETFEKIYYRKYFSNLFKYKTLLLQFTCFACQASFIIHIISYCIKNKIVQVRDGANTEYEEASPMQMRRVKEEIRRLYADHGIVHASPVYDEYASDRSDYQLFRLGLREQPNIKDNPKLYKKYQGYCKFMPASTIWLHYWRQCKGFPEDVQKQTLEHWIEEVNYIKQLIEYKIGSQ